SNLLNNASKYSPAGGRIELRAAVVNACVEISVEDHGVGIAADALPKIFEMFWQADNGEGPRRGGLGIGLALAQAVVRLHGGSIHAHSAGLGHGSTLTVRIPVVQLDETRTLSSTDQASDSVKRQVLIVDDVRDAANALGELLSAFGHDVTISY